jgi:prephenate dehydratase
VGTAAIAGHSAAEAYDAEVLIEGIEDDQQNFTRFLLLAPAESVEQESGGGRRSEMSIVFALENRTGSLCRAMAVFALRDIDLTRIVFAPDPRPPWEYSFYVDFLGNTSEPRIRHALDHLREFATWVRILGCYRRASTEIVSLPACNSQPAGTTSSKLKHYLF